MNIDLSAHQLGLLRSMLGQRMNDARENGILDEDPSSVFRYELWENLRSAEDKAIVAERLEHELRLQSK